MKAFFAKVWTAIKTFCAKAWAWALAHKILSIVCCAVLVIGIVCAIVIPIAVNGTKKNDPPKSDPSPSVTDPDDTPDDPTPPADTPDDPTLPDDTDDEAAAAAAIKAKLKEALLRAGNLTSYRIDRDSNTYDPYVALIDGEKVFVTSDVLFDSEHPDEYDRANAYFLKKFGDDSLGYYVFSLPTSSKDSVKRKIAADWICKILASDSQDLPAIGLDALSDMMTLALDLLEKGAGFRSVEGYYAFTATSEEIAYTVGIKLDEEERYPVNIGYSFTGENDETVVDRIDLSDLDETTVTIPDTRRYEGLSYADFQRFGANTLALMKTNASMQFSTWTSNYDEDEEDWIDVENENWYLDVADGRMLLKTPECFTFLIDAEKGLVYDVTDPDSVTKSERTVEDLIGVIETLTAKMEGYLKAEQDATYTFEQEDTRSAAYYAGNGSFALQVRFGLNETFERIGWMEQPNDNERISYDFSIYDVGETTVSELPAED